MRSDAQQNLSETERGQAFSEKRKAAVLVPRVALTSAFPVRAAAAAAEPEAAALPPAAPMPPRLAPPPPPPALRPMPPS